MVGSHADVAIIMGSQSDWATMRHAAETLDALGIAHETSSFPPIAPPAAL
jgi:5-(carboxyamino)imidazole ribonucleotide mutase